MATTHTTIKRMTDRPRRALPLPPKSAAAVKKIAPEQPERPSEHNGVEVDREELIEHLPGVPFRISRLYLVDGTIAFACRDCLFTDDTRGHVMEHRNEVHGAMIGKKRVKIETPPLTEAPDLIVELRAGGGPAPVRPLDMTIREIVALAPTIAALGDLVEQAQWERDQALALLGDHRLNQTKIDTWDQMRDDVTELRIQLRQQANYDDIKHELYKLRAWKKKMTTRLSGLGFVLNAEDE